MRAPLRIAAAVAGLAPLFAGHASAQVQPCTGRNLLDELKAAESASYDSVRKHADATANATKLLWKVEYEKARGTSYLFATVALSDERVLKFSPAAQQAISSVRRVAVDVANVEARRVSEGLNVLHGIGKLTFKDGSTLASHLTPVEQQTTVKALARSGLPADVAARAQPWAALALLSTSDCEQKRVRAGKPLMAPFIAQQAEKRGLGTVDLETVETQFEAASGLSPAMQLSLLKGRVATVAFDNDLNETIAQLYLAKDLGAIWPLQMALAKKQGVDEAALKAWHEQVVVERAKRLANRLHQHLVSGSVFVAVDQSLMVGPSGIVALVSNQPGFKVTPIE